MGEKFIGKLDVMPQKIEKYFFEIKIENFSMEICIDGTKHLFKLNEIKLLNKIDYSDKNRIYTVIIIL